MDQKLSDFNQLAGLYAKNYAPYELKRDLFGFDLYNLQPWLSQITPTTTDLQFYDICVKYVASLQDSHDEFTMDSDFDAWLHFDADIYDGNVLIDYIDRSYLPDRSFGAEIGDQLVSVDGVAVSDLITSFIPYSVNGSANAVSRQRLAVATITERYQGWYPLAPSIGMTAAVVVMHADGATSTYKVPWDVLGTAVTQEGPVQSPQAFVASHIAPRAPRPVHRRQLADGRLHGETNRRGVLPNPWGVWTGARSAQPPANDADYMQPMNTLAHMSRLSSGIGLDSLEPFDSLAPVFYPPPSFVLRLGAGQTDEFLSGTYTAGGHTLGYIRIPSFDPMSETNAFNQFAGEMTYFQQNTGGLVVDVMGNGGGYLCYAQQLASYLIPQTFRGVGEQIRATLNWQEDFSFSVIDAQEEGAPSWVVDLYQAYLAQVSQALSENRGLTGALPLCSYSFDQPPATDSNGNSLVYTKPLLVLTDNFTLSSAETFTMLIQDNQRGPVFGALTDGGGGNVVSVNATAYSEGYTRLTEGLITRAQPFNYPGFGPLQYYDGIGIEPDIPEVYTTVDNLVNGGQTFVNDFTTALIKLIPAQ